MVAEAGVKSTSTAAKGIGFSHSASVYSCQESTSREIQAFPWLTALLSSAALVFLVLVWMKGGAISSCCFFYKNLYNDKKNNFTKCYLQFKLQYTAHGLMFMKINSQSQRLCDIYLFLCSQTFIFIF